jgi:hypothetical protein
MEHRGAPVGDGLVPFELGTDQAFGPQAQPVAVERQRPIEVSYRKGDDMDARFHGQIPHSLAGVLQTMIGARD